MLSVSHHHLKILAAVFWYTGGVVLLLKGGILLKEAEQLRPEAPWPWIVVVAALLAGVIKAKFLFSGSCQKNLFRIAALHQPKFWQFFRPGFFVFLILMILVGATLSTLAHGDYKFLLAVASLDLIIAVALLGSSYVFWR